LSLLLLLLLSISEQETKKVINEDCKSGFFVVVLDGLSGMGNKRKTSKKEKKVLM